MTELWRGEERKARDLIVTNYVKAIRTALELLDADPLVSLGGISGLYWARFLLKKGWEMSAFEALQY